MKQNGPGMVALAVWVSLAWPLVSPAQPAVPPPPAGASHGVEDTGLTLSASGRFRVLGARVPVRRMFAGQAEEAASEYEKLMGVKISAAVPVVIQLYDPATVSVARESVVDALEVVSGQAFLLRIHVRLDDGATPAAFRESLVRCFLAADIIRGRRADEIKDGTLIPAWLEAGVVTALEHRMNPARSTLAAGVFARGRAFPVEKILKEDPTDLPAAGRVAYDASACGLVTLLLGMQNGPARLQRLLSDFAELEGDPAALIRHHFQEMAESDKALDKWWALQVAQMARPGAMDFMDSGESERRLAQALRVELQDPPEAGGGSRDMGFVEVLQIPDKAQRQRLVKTIWLRLRALAPRLHPLYRSLATAHQDLIEGVMAGKKNEAGARWVVLEEERGMLAARLDGIDDYLNWWEVTRGKGGQGDLDRYRAAVRKSEPLARKEDPVGRYLDEIQRVVAKP